jgi:sodium-coupled neutral amino acid transporter 11
VSKLAKASALALVALVIIVIAVMVESPTLPPQYYGDPTIKWNVLEPQVFQSIGVISFAFVCHHNTFIILGGLRKPTLNRTALVTHMSTGISLVFCLVLAVIGYQTFTDKTQGNVLNNFPKDNTFINVARLCFGMNMFTTFPLEHLVAREVIENLWFDNIYSQRVHVALTSALVGTSLLISLVTCDLGFVLELTGGFSATALAFILPPAIYLQLASGPVLSCKKLPHVLCIGFGLMVMVLSTFLAIRKAWAPHDAAQCGW